MRLTAERFNNAGVPRRLLEHPRLGRPVLESRIQRAAAHRQPAPQGALRLYPAAAPQRRGAQAYLALYENNLSTQVTAGENRGKRLQHDFVVRELSGPHAVDSQGEVALSHRFKLDPRWKSADLHVAAFVQNEQTGDILQALAVPNCR